MSFWTLESLRVACGGSWVQRPPGVEGVIASGLSIDSRSLKAGEVFLAIRGDRVDGHDFVHQAAAAGAAMCIIDRDASDQAIKSSTGAAIVRVADTRRALLKLASAYRKTLEGRVKVVAITGSNGKTTTTRLIESVLAASMPTTASPHSFNNHIGVPLTILSAKPGDRALVCEIGSNHPGEVSELSRIVEPHIAVITSLGREHLAGFGTIEHVAREEASVVQSLRPGGFAVVNGDSSLLVETARAMAAGRVSVYTFGRSETSDLRIVEVSQRLRPRPEVRFSLAPPKIPAEFTVPMIGAHNALNAAAAVAVGRRMGLSDDAIASSLANARTPEKRCQVVELDDGVTVINDAYNANPESMHASIDMLQALETEGRGRVAVLGDMLELGSDEHALHVELLQHAVIAEGLRTIITVGPRMAVAARELASALVSASFGVLNEDSNASIASTIRPGEIVLLKASNALRLWTVVDALRARPSTSATRSTHFEPTVSGSLAGHAGR